MARFWSCVQTHPRGEGLALRNLRRQGFTAFYPFFLTPGRFHRPLTTPVFPGYVFVELDDDTNWSPINSTMGVARLLTTAPTEEDDYRQPARVPFIAKLRNLRPLRRPGAGEPDPDTPIPLGTTVTITQGPFAGRRALVTLSGPERVRLMLECFAGREFEIELGVTDLDLSQFGKRVAQ